MTELSGLKALVVEDEGGVALLIESMLTELGCEIAASVAHLADACRIAATAPIDLAVLDVNLAGRPVYPVAQILRDRQIPFVFSTGYGASGLPDEFKSHPVLGKPFTLVELQRQLLAALPSTGPSDVS
jgi:CheY-like chemotaxis protein